MPTRRSILTLAAALPLLALSRPALADGAAVFAPGGKAIRGIDPVAYFSEGRPVMGSEVYRLRWNGAEWLFATAANMATFESDPMRYAPQYGGYCAYAMARGDKVKTDPEAWKIVDGKLYLNYSPAIKRTWETDIPGYVDKADAAWNRLRE